MKKIMLLLCCLLPALGFAQGKISKVAFLRHKDAVVISYYQSAYKLTDVKVFMNSDGSTRLLKHVTGDVGNVRGSGYKEIIFDINAEFKGKPIPEIMSFTVTGEGDNFVRKRGKNVPWHLSLEYLYSYSAPFGMGYAIFSKWGGYARFKISLLRGEVEDAGYTYSIGDAKKRYYRQSYTAGVVRMVYDNVWVYGGLGYGIYAPVDKVKEVSEYGTTSSYYYWGGPLETGLELEIGLMVNIKGFFLSAGYGSIAGKKMPFLSNLNVSIGYVIEL